jgi:hypothetical protein
VTRRRADGGTSLLALVEVALFGHDGFRKWGSQDHFGRCLPSSAIERAGQKRGFDFR